MIRSRGYTRGAFRRGTALLLGVLIVIAGPIAGPIVSPAGASSRPNNPAVRPPPPLARGATSVLSSSVLSSWALQQTPNVAPTSLGVLQSVSCTSSSWCEAVGDYNGTHSLAELWNGTGWELQPTSIAWPTTLNGVSCTSETACTAVGYFVDGTQTHETYVMSWNGSQWSSVTTPNPSGASGTTLNSVSCTSALACTAVGDYYSSATELTLVERWDGTSWSIKSSPDPSGADASQLGGVSCTSTSNCTAVGYYDNGAGIDVPMAMAWNGTSWKIESTPSPSGAMFSLLTGVSCTSVGRCSAVGYYESATETFPALVEQWNGTSWKIQSIADPAGATRLGLSSVSCPAATQCTAVGSYESASGAEVTWAEVWNGSSWKPQATANPTAHGVGAQLFAVSCSSAPTCAAVGQKTSAVSPVTLAEGWSGGKWQIQETAQTAPAQLSGLSCTAASACTAVGYYENTSSVTVPLAERWNGSSWTVQSVPAPTGAASSYLTAASCSSASACTAVGYYMNGSPGSSREALAETWNGSAWKVQAVPEPSGLIATSFYGVSCTSASACVGVGYEYTTTYNSGHTFAEVWNGATWDLQTTPNPTGAIEPVLSAISCKSSTACTTVGNYANSVFDYFTLALAWNGTTWRLQATPNPSGGGELTGVSCSSSTACSAVGYGDPEDPVALAEAWNGTTWKIQTIPNPGIYAYLLAISCSSASACTAVGSYEGFVGLGFAELWNGRTWTVQSTASPSGSLASYLTGVSCRSATTCTAAGTYVGSLGATRALAEDEAG